MTTFLINSGHGEDTKGKRSPFIPPGIKEWEFNFNVAVKIMEYASSNGIEVCHLDPEFNAVPLAEIVRRANEIHEHHIDCIFVSIHANAVGDGDACWMLGAKGSRVLTSPNASAASRMFAEILAPKIAEYAYFKNGGVHDRNLYVLNKTNCPSVLSENGFMTHPDDATKLAQPYWQEQIAIAHVEAMKTWCER